MTKDPRRVSLTEMNMTLLPSPKRSPRIRPALLGSGLLTSGLAVAAVFFSGCSSGGRTAGVAGTGGNFVVLNTEPPNNGRLFLNESLIIRFSNPVDLETA